jgi:hypothetical protein
MNIQEWMIPDESDPDVEDAVLAELMARRVDQQLRTQANGRTVRIRSTQNPSVAVVEVRGRSAMSEAREELRAALLKYADVESLLGRFGGKQPPVGSVLRWTKRFEAGSGELRLKQKAAFGEDVVFEAIAPTEYVYIALRTSDGWWYVTGTRGRERQDWDTLVKQIGDAPAQLVSKWEEVPVPEKPSEESLDPESWARMMFGSKTVEGSTSAPTE